MKGIVIKNKCLRIVVWSVSSLVVCYSIEGLWGYLWDRQEFFSWHNLISSVLITLAVGGVLWVFAIREKKKVAGKS